MDRIQNLKTSLPKLVYLLIIWVFISPGCGTGFGTSNHSINADGREKWCREIYGVTVFYKPAKIDTYRRLLPNVFDMPAEPLVQVYVYHFSKMASWFKPYHETAVFLLAKYQGRTIWHCITMPVTTNQSRIGGIRLGYPKVLADITLDHTTSEYRGVLKSRDKTILELSLTALANEITVKEKQWFDKLKSTGSLNIRNGRVYDPLPAMSYAWYSMYDLSRLKPDLFTVKVGQAKLTMLPEAAPNDKDWRPSAFAIEPAEMVLAYYFKNRVGFDW